MVARLGCRLKFCSSNRESVPYLFLISSLLVGREVLLLLAFLFVFVLFFPNQHVINALLQAVGWRWYIPWMVSLRETHMCVQ